MPQTRRQPTIGTRCWVRFNAAFTLLGRLIEVASGTIYNTAMQNLLCGSARVDRNGARPAGSTSTLLLGRALCQPDQQPGQRGRAVPVVGAPLR